MTAHVRFVLRSLAGAAVAVVVGGCLPQGKPLVAERSPVFTATHGGEAGGFHDYTVRKGDTLNSIAWRFELDYRGLARANGVSAPYVIRPGQKLRLTTAPPASRRVVERPASPPEAPRTAPRAAGNWVWPMSGKPTSEFSDSSKGLDFGVPSGRGAAVRAAAEGQIVYAGSGLGGFERLIIIKHNSALLSAYGFNGRLVVEEGARVVSGATIGQANPRQPAQSALHFEIRNNGAPVNPRKYLRKGSSE